MSAKRAGSCFLFIILVSLAGSFAIGTVGMFYPQIYNLVPSNILSELMILVPTLIIALLTPASALDMFPLRRMRWSLAGLSVLLMAVSFPIVTFCNAVSLMFVDNTVLEISDDIISSPLPVMLLLVGVYAPICEELVFRGYIFQNLKKSGRLIASAVISGLLFGLIHLNFNQALYAAVMGIIFALAVDACGSLWSSVIMHMLLNSLEVIGMYAAAAASDLLESTGSLQGLLEAGEDEITPAVLAGYGAAAAVGVVLVVLILRKMRAISDASLRENSREELQGYLGGGLNGAETPDGYSMPGGLSERPDAESAFGGPDGNPGGDDMEHARPDVFGAYREDTGAPEYFAGEPQEMLRGDAITEAEFPREESGIEEKKARRIISIPLVIGILIAAAYIAAAELLL